MENVPEKLVKNRMAEPLETELQKRGIIQNQQADMKRALDKWNDGLEMTEEIMEAYTGVEDAIARYCYVYGETAYCLGYSDGRLTGMEQGADGKKSVLSLEDMTSLVYMYDAIKKLNITMLGDIITHQKENGVFGALDRIYNVIFNCVCAEITLADEDKQERHVFSILDEDTSLPEKRARKLLGK
jgi:hypothetical protein